MNVVTTNTNPPVNTKETSCKTSLANGMCCLAKARVSIIGTHNALTTKISENIGLSLSLYLNLMILKSVSANSAPNATLISTSTIKLST